MTCSCHKIHRDEAVGLKRCKYTLKITQRLVSEENAFENIKNPSLFFHRTIRSNNSFTLKLKTISGFKDSEV